MKIFALSDPHLSRSQDKPMDIFGGHWTDHITQIAKAWDVRVGPDDLVLVPGDISWAMKLPQALPDLEHLHARPGVKLLTKGNHDLWWPRKKRQFLLEGLDSMLFLHGRTLRFGPVGMAVTRGWTIPGDSWFTAQDQKVYDKELRYLEAALADLGDASVRIAVLHYPPWNNRKEAGGAIELFHKYGVQHVVHGHLHGAGCDRATVTGERDGIIYHLTSCDFIGFDPVEILNLPDLDIPPLTVVEGNVVTLPNKGTLIGPLVEGPFPPRPVELSSES